DGVCVRENESQQINNKGKTRVEITKLIIDGQKLEGELDLSDFTNLKEIECIKNNINCLDITRVEKGFYNRFYGSLKPLENMENLKVITIQNTDIDCGLEWLPIGVEKILFVENNQRFHNFSNFRHKKNRGRIKLKQLEENEKLPKEIENIEKYITEIKKNIKLLETNSQQVVNTYITVGDINVGNTIGGKANITNQYATKIEELETRIEIVPK
ncbi:13659_t:CDS:2, partial [Entrophospora sp. SA101]